VEGKVVDIAEERLDAGALAWRAQGVGLAALLLSLVLGAFDSASFFRAYILNFCFFLSLALGALFFVMLQHLTRAGWSVVVRRVPEAVLGAFPLLALLALPIVIPVLIGWPDGIRAAYPWTDQAEVAREPLLQHKAPYLNPWFFALRLGLYFAVWIGLATYMVRRSVQQDVSGDPELTRQMGRMSAPGMVLFGLTLTFAIIDLIMTMTPAWYSTIFGVYYFAGSVVGIMAVMALAFYGLQRMGFVKQAVTVEHYHDIGKLLFAFVVFWAYIAYSQYMLYWYANMPETTSWYLVRQTGPWFGLSVLLLVGHFFLPFLFLISRGAKRQRELLLAGAAWCLFMHWLDLFYLVMPPYFFALARDPRYFQDRLLDAPFSPQAGLLALTLLVALGGLVLATVLRRLSAHPLVPQRDPRLDESLAFENF
jgi:hypothetical protein